MTTYKISKSVYCETSSMSSLIWLMNCWSFNDDGKRSEPYNPRVHNYSSRVQFMVHLEPLIFNLDFEQNDKYVMKKKDISMYNFYDMDVVIDKYLLYRVRCIWDICIEISRGFVFFPGVFVVPLPAKGQETAQNGSHCVTTFERNRQHNIQCQNAPICIDISL